MRKLVIRFNAPATLTFALLALGALLLGQTFGSAVTTKYFCVYRSSLADPLTYLRFFTHVLGHADYSHYMGNMLLLLLVGPPLEEKYGWKKWCGLCSSRPWSRGWCSLFSSPTAPYWEPAVSCL